jgi:hypothetical protein
MSISGFTHSPLSGDQKRAFDERYLHAYLKAKEIAKAADPARKEFCVVEIEAHPDTINFVLNGFGVDMWERTHINLIDNPDFLPQQIAIGFGPNQAGVPRRNGQLLIFI